MINNSYIYEVQFYLSMIIYKKYLQNKNILLDIYMRNIRYIYNDYIQYDNSKKSLIESIEDYIKIKEDFILNLLKECEN